MASHLTSHFAGVTLGLHRFATPAMNDPASQLYFNEVSFTLATTLRFTSVSMSTSLRKYAIYKLVIVWSSGRHGLEMVDPFLSGIDATFEPQQAKTICIALLWTNQEAALDFQSIITITT